MGNVDAAEMKAEIFFSCIICTTINKADIKILNNHYFVNHYVRIICCGLGPSQGTWVSPVTHTSLQGKFYGHFEI